MKILAVSDSHGNVGNLLRAAEAVRPEMIFHLGDGWRDAEVLRERFDIPLLQVPGNCDLVYGQEAERLLELEGRRILLCHGHTYGVKYSMTRAGLAAQEKGLDLFFFGHTHRPLWEWSGRTLFINPGSAGAYHKPTYAVVELSDGQVGGRICELDSGFS